MNKSMLRLACLVGILAVALPAAPPQATVTSPNGGENLLLGSEHSITWDCSDCAGNANVIIEIFNTLNSGPGYHGQISPGGVPMSQGVYQWQEVGKLSDGTFVKPGPGYKIHLEAIDGSDASDGTFAIVKLELPRIVISQLNLSHLPGCPECVRIELKPLLDPFKNCRGIFRLALFANGEIAAELGKFGNRKRMRDFVDTRLSLPLQDLAQGRRGRFELRLFNSRGQLMQAQAVQLHF